MKIFEVVVGVIKKEDQVLVLRHNKCRGLCLFPSGKVEDNEHLFDALKREMNEELGIEVINAIPLSSSEQNYEWYDRVDGIMHTHETVYWIRDYKNIPYNKEPNKHLEMKWVSKEDIINNPQDYTNITYRFAMNWM